MTTINNFIFPDSFLCRFAGLPGRQFHAAGFARLLNTGLVLVPAIADVKELSIFRPELAAFCAATFPAKFRYSHDGNHGL
ncbi:hypothetical protein [Marinobacter fuscus]|uniref:hypothetical protein n=1 Tax=Marinobacter fuscus TaxID=2109942 RepID=UPI0010574625|nr:hypothetical protein [Marinobacter fuscus]